MSEPIAGGPGSEPPSYTPPPGPPSAPPPGGPPARPGLAWDREKSAGTLVETVKALVTAPGDAFARMLEKGDYLSPVLFIVIVGGLGAIVGQIWQLVFGAAWTGMLPAEYRGELAPMLASQGAGAVFMIVLLPVLMPVFAFIGAGIYHLFLMLFGGHKESTAGFEGTFRVVAYSSVAQLAQVVPFVGSIVAMVWSIVLMVLGLSTVHRTSQGKALAAVLVPWLVCCLCAIGFAVMAGMSIAGMAGAFGN